MVLDAVCSAGAFAIGSNLSQMNLPAWGIGLQLVAYFGGARPWAPPVTPSDETANACRQPAVSASPLLPLLI